MTTSGRSIAPTVKAPKMAQLIAAQIRGQIVRGELEPGDHMPRENELLQQFGVSRPILREAFRILEQESLISVRRGSNGGPRILAPNLEVGAHYVGLLLQMRGATMADVYEASVVIEPACAALMAEKATPEDIALLQECIAGLEDAIAAAAGGRPERRVFLQLSNQFHEVMLNSCGNPALAVQANVLLHIIAMHYEQTVPARYDSLRPSLFPRVVAGFVTLVELAQAHDSEGASRHWRSVIEFTKRLQGADLKDRSLLDLFA